MERFKNHYRALNIPSTADATTIKAAFRRLALRYHPDRARSTRTTRRFKEIREAYEILSDPETRRQYDEIYRAHTALRPVISDVEGPEVNARARTGSAGIGITVDLLGLKLGLAVDASASRRAARLPKPPPRKGPPRKGPRPR